MLHAGTSFATIESASIIVPSPIETPLKMITLNQIPTLLEIFTEEIFTLLQSFLPTRHLITSWARFEKEVEWEL